MSPTAVDERTWSVEFPHHPRAAGQARRRLVESLAGALPAATLEDAGAVLAELVGNAVRHATALPGGVVRIDWQVNSDGGIELRVTDGGADSIPTPRAATAEAVDGRGLAIVAAFSQDWGVEADRHGQCVWARLHSA
jgi:anti-sigma regulatory factor (Ser/Thr protein kinase)